jgi:uncharacterized protein (DUF433 family)
VNQTFRTDGVDLFVDRYGKLLNVSRAGQVTMRDALTSSLKRIEWDREGLAARLYPWVRSGAGEQPRTIVIDPARAFGKPALKGTGIPTEIVAERYRAGESIGELVADYGVAPSLIEDALRCEWREAS